MLAANNRKYINANKSQLNKKNQKVKKKQVSNVDEKFVGKNFTFIFMGTFVALFIFVALKFGAVGYVKTYVSNIWFEQTKRMGLQYQVAVPFFVDYEQDITETMKQEMLSAIDVELGESLLAIDIVKVKDNIEKLPWVSKTIVRRSFPDKLDLIVISSDAYVSMNVDGYDILLDNEGNVVSEVNLSTNNQNLLTIKGDNAFAYSSGIIELLSQYSELAKFVEHAQLVSNRRWDLHMQSGQVIQLPEDNIENVLKNLMTKDKQYYQLINSDLYDLDLRVPEQLILRQRTDSLNDFDKKNDDIIYHLASN